MIVADALGVPMENVRVVHSDTDEVAARRRHRRVAFAARSAAARCSVASEEVLAQAKQLAAHLLEANPDDIVIGDGGARGRGRAREHAVVGRARGRGEGPARRPEGMAERLAARARLTSPTARRSRSARTSRSSRSTPTPAASSCVRHIAVDDCGTIVNPLLVAGQQHGGIGAGRRAGAVRRGAVRRGRQPDHRRTSWTTRCRRRRSCPSYEVFNTETPSPLNPLGAKGIGESATLGSTPAVHNAIVDALSHLGVRHIDMPCTAERVWRAMQAAARDDARSSRSRRCGSRSRSTRRSSATATTACPTRRAGCSIGPLGGDGEPTGRDHRGAAVPQRRRVGAHLHRRRRATCSRAIARGRGARRRDRRRVALPHPHRRVPVAHRRAPGRRPRLVYVIVQPPRRRPDAARLPHRRRRRSPRSRSARLLTAAVACRAAARVPAVPPRRPRALPRGGRAAVRRDPPRRRAAVARGRVRVGVRPLRTGLGERDQAVPDDVHRRARARPALPDPRRPRRRLRPARLVRAGRGCARTDDVGRGADDDRGRRARGVAPAGMAARARTRRAVGRGVRDLGARVRARGQGPSVRAEEQFDARWRRRTSSSPVTGARSATSATTPRSAGCCWCCSARAVRSRGGNDSARASSRSSPRPPRCSPARSATSRRLRRARVVRRRLRGHLAPRVPRHRDGAPAVAVAADAIGRAGAISSRSCSCCCWSAWSAASGASTTRRRGSTRSTRAPSSRSCRRRAIRSHAVFPDAAPRAAERPRRHRRRRSGRLV